MNYFIKSIKKIKNIYTFLFKNKANKLNIKNEIEKRYNVTVKNVRTMILLLKKKDKKNNKYRKIKKVFIELKKYQNLEI